MPVAEKLRKQCSNFNSFFLLQENITLFVVIYGLDVTYSAFFFLFGASNMFIGSVVIMTGRTEPKKSVIGTLAGSLLKRSLRTPTVDRHALFGHTAS